MFITTTGATIAGKAPDDERKVNKKSQNVIVYIMAAALYMIKLQKVFYVSHIFTDIGGYGIKIKLAS